MRIKGPPESTPATLPTAPIALRSGPVQTQKTPLPGEPALRTSNGTTRPRKSDALGKSPDPLAKVQSDVARQAEGGEFGLELTHLATQLQAATSACTLVISMHKEARQGLGAQRSQGD